MFSWYIQKKTFVHEFIFYPVIFCLYGVTLISVFSYALEQLFDLTCFIYYMNYIAADNKDQL